jgi:hypothetical protein
VTVTGASESSSLSLSNLEFVGMRMHKIHITSKMELNKLIAVEQGVQRLLVKCRVMLRLRSSTSLPDTSKAIHWTNMLSGFASPAVSALLPPDMISIVTCSELRFRFSRSFCSSAAGHDLRT